MDKAAVGNIQQFSGSLHTKQSTAALHTVVHGLVCCAVERLTASHSASSAMCTYGNINCTYVASMNNTSAAAAADGA
jgi:hypothetical protein